MPELLLIQPLFENKKLDRNVKTVYPLGLGYIAAYVPDNWKVSIVDEQIDEIDYSANVDLVGISTTTLTINRAYDIASKFRKRGVKVILGGVHASMLPDEAGEFCDSVLIGDAEKVIGDVLKDCEKNKLKKIYRGALNPLDQLKEPRRDLFKSVYSFLPVSTSRGCPFDCSFCAINRFYKGKYRTRNVEEVITELRNLPAGHDIVFFTDGNIYGYSKKDIARFKELCRRIIEERKKKPFNFRYFAGYVSVNALSDTEALDLASKAGCMILFVGFESINPDSLKDMNKVLNLKYGVDSYHELVANAQKRKMLVVGEMIVGSDSDNMPVLEKTRAFLKKINFDVLRLQIMQPLPGTRLFESLQRENRLLLKNFPEDWQKISQDFVMGVHYIPKNIDPYQLKRWVKETGLLFYSPINILRRAMKSFYLTGSLKLFFVTIMMNLKSRKSYQVKL